MMALVLPTQELLKIPFMIEHYKKHKAEDASMTVWRFIKIHYDGCNNIYGDESDDAKLPFKATDGKIDVTSFQCIISSPLKIFTSFQNEVILEKFLFRFEDADFIQAAIKLFQPPKLF
jgi:hypothetical protein